MEEVPASWRNWRAQRTRWIKGWIQTYLVHMRRPLRLWRDLGAWKFAGFQLMIGATILSLLVHPWFYVLAAMHGSFGERLAPESDLLLWVSGSNLVADYGAAMLVTWPQLSRQARRAGCCPSYGCRSIGFAISYAAYRAVLHLIVRPFYWEKTMPGSSMQRPTRPAPGEMEATL